MYCANASKTWLVVKEKFREQAEAAFADTAANIASEGRPHLGAPLGAPDYVSRIVSEKVLTWLSVIAATEPHTAFAAYTHGLINKGQYLTRTVPGIGNHLELSINLFPT